MAERIAVVETLEGRRLLSSTPVLAFMPVGTSKAGAHEQAVDAEYQARVAHSIAVGKAAGIAPSVVGTWKGKVQFSKYFITKKFDVTMEITKVTATNATGTITIDGHKFSGTLKGVTKKTEEFSYTYTKGKDSVTVDGLLNGLNTAATGVVKAKYSGWSVNGTFSMTKVKPTTV